MSAKVDCDGILSKEGFLGIFKEVDVRVKFLILRVNKGCGGRN